MCSPVDSSSCSAPFLVFGRLVSRLGHVVVCFAEGTAGSTGGEPGIYAGGVEGVTAGQAADVVVVFDCVEADCAGVAGVGKEFGGDCGLDLVDVFFVIFIWY
jgi:hypothetical protein